MEESLAPSFAERQAHKYHGADSHDGSDGKILLLAVSSAASLSFLDTYPVTASNRNVVVSCHGVHHRVDVESIVPLLKGIHDGRIVVTLQPRISQTSSDVRCRYRRFDRQNLKKPAMDLIYMTCDGGTDPEAENDVGEASQESSRIEAYRQ